MLTFAITDTDHSVTILLEACLLWLQQGLICCLLSLVELFSPSAPLGTR